MKLGFHETRWLHIFDLAKYLFHFEPSALQSYCIAVLQLDGNIEDTKCLLISWYFIYFRSIDHLWH